MADQPNILFITADHLRYDKLAFNGDPVIQTPALDRLASRGVVFDRCFAQNPVCQPSRASIMTGRYPRHHGVRWNEDRLNENEITLVEHFKIHGYETACVGKHHISQERFLKALDYAAATDIRRNWKERADGDYTVATENEFERYVRDKGYVYRTGFALPDFRARLGAVPSDLPEDCHLDAFVGLKAREYLTRQRRHRPFFLWLGFYGPHHPYVPSGRFGRMYDPQTVPPFQREADDLARKPPEYRLYCQIHDHKYRGFAAASEATFRAMKAAYYGMVSQLDWQLGMTLDQLDESGLADHTLVVFTSDHGEFLGDHGFPAKAPFLLDCMLHVPCLFRGPGVAGGRRCSDLVELVDLFPTLVTQAGLDPVPWVQGRDLSARLTGAPPSGHLPRTAIYAEAVDKKCIRTCDWKYIHYPGRSYGELYDLGKDPHELRNLYAEQPARVSELRGAFHELLDATEDFCHPSYMQFTGRDPATGVELRHYHTW
jgi:arylsulfatase